MRPQSGPENAVQTNNPIYYTLRSVTMSGHVKYRRTHYFSLETLTFLLQLHEANFNIFKEYSLEVRAELPETKVADSQPSLRAGRPEGLVELSATEVWGNQTLPKYYNTPLTDKSIVYMGLETPQNLYILRDEFSFLNNIELYRRSLTVG